MPYFVVVGAVVWDFGRARPCAKLRVSKVDVCCVSWGLCYDFYGVKTAAGAVAKNVSIAQFSTKLATLEDSQLSPCEHEMQICISVILISFCKVMQLSSFSISVKKSFIEPRNVQSLG
jgi:hypothetical protein